MGNSSCQTETWPYKATLSFSRHNIWQIYHQPDSCVAISSWLSANPSTMEQYKDYPSTTHGRLTGFRM